MSIGPFFKWKKYFWMFENAIMVIKVDLLSSYASNRSTVWVLTERTELEHSVQSRFRGIQAAGFDMFKKISLQDEQSKVSRIP